MAPKDTSSQSSPLLADIWQKIPPKDKVKLIAEAQSTGISTCLVLFSCAAAIAVGLKMPWAFWGTCFVLPFAFQLSSARAWRTVKARVVVEHTAARSTACWFAKQAQGQDLNPSLVFKGKLERIIDENVRKDSETWLDRFEDTQPIAVWITLFPDSFVMFSETPRGARKEFACSLYEELAVSSEGFEDEPGAPRKVLLSLTRGETVSNWSLTSEDGASIIVCERKLQSSIDKRNFLLQQQESAQRLAAAKLAESRQQLGA